MAKVTARQPSIGRLLAHPFASQLRAVVRDRIADPTRLVQWFNHWERNVQDFTEKATALEKEDKDSLLVMLKIYETIVGRPSAIAVAAGDNTTNQHALNMSEAFDVMKDFVRCVGEKHVNGLLIVGPGGTGKTVTVVKSLQEMGLVEGQQYIRIPGYSTPLALFNTLYAAKDKLVVFDDCDSIIGSEAGLNILKAVLDTLPERHVSWKSTSTKADVNDFIFKGQIIFISNMDPEKTNDPNFKALLTRVLTLIVGSNKEQLLARMLQLLDTKAMGEELTDVQRAEVRAHLLEVYSSVRFLSLRFLSHMIGLRKFDQTGTKWKNLIRALA
jgi:Cdc6-like AAA superfamily ATPase